MGRGRRGLGTVWPAVGVVVVLVAGVVVVASRTSGSGGEPARTTALAPAAPAADSSDQPGSHGFIDVAVATLWLEPESARPVDDPSLANPVDLDRWVSSMTVPDKLWLVGKLATQALYGDRVTVLETSGDWTKVAVERQPSSLDPRGYPGWLPTAQLSFRPMPDTGSHAVVTKAKVALATQADHGVQATQAGPGVGATQAGRSLEVSFNTMLPVVSVDGGLVTVATPSGRNAVLAASDVEVFDHSPRPPSGADVVHSAQLFSGLPYLWAGTSASGFDCSGFTSAVYGAHGVVIPRDADEQAGTGTPVDLGQLEPGDLLFYAYDGGRGDVHHVSMYIGNGLMIQSPATGRTVETVPVDTPAYTREFWGARRYLFGSGS